MDTVLTAKDAATPQAAPRVEYKKGICGICPAGCYETIKLVDGKLESIKPVKGHPMGILCTRGAYSNEIIYSEDRLKYPMKRVGERGSGKFERISWDEALDGIAAKIKALAAEHGPESIANYFGRGSFDISLNNIFAVRRMHNACSNIFFPLGSPNTFGAGSLCYVSYGILAPMTTFGKPEKMLSIDYEHSNLIVVWGGNPPTDSPPFKWKQLLAARRRGSKVIVIDHVRTETGKIADEWVPIRPGTDGALALAMINVVIEEGLYDKEFCDNWTVGFDELRQYVKEFTPEKAAQITWVPAETIRRLAREIAATQGVGFCSYTGLEYTNSGVQNIRATFILMAITGNFDQPGAWCFRMPAPPSVTRNVIEAPKGKPPIGADTYPLFCEMTDTAHALELPRAILEGDPYAVKALVICGAAMMISFPQPELWRRCLEKLDLVVVIDRFLSIDAPHADYLLPATTLYENEGYMAYPFGHVQYRERIIEPLGEARSDVVTFIELAKRLGYGHLYPQNEREVVDWVLKDGFVEPREFRSNPDGFPTPKKEMQYRKWEKGLLRGDKKPGFPTPSGKYEIASTSLARHGHDPLPKYTEPKEGPISTPELLGEFPLVLNSGLRLQSTYRSQHLNILGLLKLQDKPQVWMHPRDAAPRGINQGDRVYVTTRRGRVPFYANVTEDIVRGAVECNVGGGGPQQKKEWREANTNHLTDHDNRDPISGFPVFKALLCNVEKDHAYDPPAVERKAENAGANGRTQSNGKH
ncbi:MAG: molybdopterin-dependent oxidoreductase [Candidatus Tectomicrobia bacterium]|nr:molybdopterin-dependent oxidoreductase [Candidatus Tectomicrobia bacterium]